MTAPEPTVDDLTTDDHDAHATDERIIERGLATFVEVGEALARIRDRRSYLLTHATFDDYCRDRWGLTAGAARNVIGAAAVTASMEAVAPDAPRPTNSRQARELAGLDPEEAAAVMQETHDTTDGKPTAAAIRETREQRHLTPVPDDTRTPRQIPVAERVEVISRMAAEGHTSRQIAQALGYSRSTAITRFAKKHGIDIPADSVMAGTHSPKADRIAAATVSSLEGLATGVTLIDYDELDPEAAAEWVDSLTDAMRELNRFTKKIKEVTTR